MNSSISPDMISFDPNYSQNILNGVGSASVFGPEKEEKKSIEIFPIGTRYRYFGTGGSSLELSTNLVLHPIDFRSVIIWEKAAKVKATEEVCHSYASRIEFLQEEAIIEGVTFNKDSKRDFWMFIKSIPFIRRGSLFLMDNGDLRVVWDDDEDNLVGLQFLGNSLARYVIFKRRAEDEPVSRVAGRDTLQGIDDQIRAFELATLLSA